MAEKTVKVEQTFARSDWQFPHCVCLEDVRDIVCLAFLLNNSSLSQIEECREIRVASFKVSVGLAVGVVCLEVQSVAQTSTNFSL